MTLCMCCGIPIGFINSFPLTIILFFLLLVFGGALVPVLTGMNIDSIPIKLKTTGVALSQFIFNLVGYMPGPPV